MVNLADIEIGIGAWAWGDSMFWGYGKGYAEADIREAFTVITSHEHVLIDTAEVYGMGKSETFIGQFAQQSKKRPPIATKFAPLPWRWSQSDLLKALRSSLRRLNIAQVNLYQIHWHLPLIPIEQWVNALSQASEEGLTRAIGVSNYDKQQTHFAHEQLAQRGLVLASNQVKYSLLDRRIERNGLLDTCQQLGVRVIAYSPLEQGLLTGKYTPENPPPGVRGWRYSKQLAAVEPLINTLREIGHAYPEGDVAKTPAQVAINWCICKGTLPIPGAKNAKQAEQNIGASGWRLRQEDVAVLDNLSSEIAIKLGN